MNMNLELMLTFYFNVSTKYTNIKGHGLHLESDLNGIMYASSSSHSPLFLDRWEIKQDKPYTLTTGKAWLVATWGSITLIYLR